MNIESIRSIISSTVAEAIQILKARNIVDDDFTINIKLRNGTKQSRSCGGLRHGKPFISIAINKYTRMRDEGIYSFQEYDAFKNDPFIGSYTGTAKKTLMALVVHEVAHAAQFYEWSKNIIAYNGDKSIRGHGAVWKSIYKTLRTKMELINTVNVQPDEDVIILSDPEPKVVKKNRTPRSNSLLARAKTLYAESNNKSREYIVTQFINVLGMKPNSATTYFYTVIKSVG